MVVDAFFFFFSFKFSSFVFNRFVYVIHGCAKIKVCFKEMKIFVYLFILLVQKKKKKLLCKLYYKHMETKYYSIFVIWQTYRNYRDTEIKKICVLCKCVYLLLSVFHHFLLTSFLIGVFFFIHFVVILQFLSFSI